MNVNAESLSRIDDFLSSSVIELLQSYGQHIERVEDRTLDIKELFVSAIGFTSENLLGVLVLSANRAFSEQSLPGYLKSVPPSDEIIADWTGELSNQILGRIKNRFYGAGIEIYLSTPSIFAGKELRHFAYPVPIDRRLYFEGGGSLLIEFQADFEKDFEIGPSAFEQAENAVEGEALFF